ncbi:hypothetical protein PV328_007670 [Microctonus aethiopoides]|uniref:FP protein C-terminal domain-containing protein n=1 Tax=Microctonus aethiopoides TaxID=144406 RepID=A0AA39C9N1_9HYME|nr:hypothetical protein PV328_007670 [Microctonus aethiopoides]
MENMDIDPHVELDKLLEGMDEEIALPATPRPTPARQPSTLPTINPRYGARRGDWMMADSSVTSGITTTSTVAVSPTEPSVSVPTTTTSSTAAIAPSKIPHSTPKPTGKPKVATKAQPKIVAIECVKPPGLVKEKTVEHTTAKTQKRTIRVPESTPAAKALAQPIPRIPAPPPATSLRKLMVIPSVKPTVSRIPVIATTTPASARPNVSTSNITKVRVFLCEKDDEILVSPVNTHYFPRGRKSRRPAKNDKLTEIKNIAKSVAEQQVRIQKLKQQNVILSKNVVDLSQQNSVIVNYVHDIREGLANMTEQPSSELIISGIPAELELEPKQMNNANQNDVNNHRNKLSYIVKFKSVYVSRHVIDLKKRKGDLTASEVFDCPLTSKIYINEFLSPKMHSLHCKVKELAKTHKYKYVWVKHGNISVREEDKSSIIVVRTDHDLRLLETS